MTDKILNSVCENLKSVDQYFVNDVGAQLMNCLLCEFEELGVSRKKIEKFINITKKNITLKDIFKYFEKDLTIPNSYIYY